MITNFMIKNLVMTSLVSRNPVIKNFVITNFIIMNFVITHCNYKLPLVKSDGCFISASFCLVCQLAE